LPSFFILHCPFKGSVQGEQGGSAVISNIRKWSRTAAIEVYFDFEQACCLVKIEYLFSPRRKI
jgi:hypothetical protein